MVKIKYLCKSFTTPLTQEDLKEGALYPVYGAAGLMGYVDNYSSDKDYIGVVKDGAGVGRIEKYPGKSSLLGTMAYIIPNEGTNLDWLKYALVSLELGKNIGATTIPHIYFSQYGNRYVNVPTYNQQLKIASFLNSKCTSIDAVIEKTKASIEEYKKLKQAIITQAVTKGIRLNRKMKESGIEWIGEIPEEWEVTKFGRLVFVKSNLVDPQKYKSYYQIAPDNIEKGSASLLGDIRTVEEVGVESWNHLFFKGQIIYSKIRPLLNKVIIAPFDGLCSADMYPIETDNCKEYIVYMMLSDCFLSQVGLVTMNRVKMPKINQSELSNIVVAFPNIEEQKEIARYLDEKCKDINDLINKKQKHIADMELYKRAIIYEYVTGKKEVPL